MFSRFEHREDPFKDEDDRGTNQRYHEMLAMDIDQNLIPLIDKIIDRTIVPSTMQSRYIPYMEDMLGITVINEDLNVRREMIKNWIPLMSIKGTLPSYQLLFRILGFFDVQIDDLTFLQGFDSPVTFDDPERVFDDTQCQPCSYYTLTLSGFVEMTADVYDMIIKAVKLVEPINAKLFSVIYNQSELSFAIFVAENGDLIYEPLSGDNTNFRLSANGDLYVVGANASAYRLNANGDLTKY